MPNIAQLLVLWEYPPNSSVLSFNAEMMFVVVGYVASPNTLLSYVSINLNS